MFVVIGIPNTIVLTAEEKEEHEESLTSSLPFVVHDLRVTVAVVVLVCVDARDVVVVRFDVVAAVVVETSSYRIAILF